MPKLSTQTHTPSLSTVSGPKRNAWQFCRAFYAEKSTASEVAQDAAKMLREDLPKNSSISVRARVTKSDNGRYQALVVVDGSTFPIMLNRTRNPSHIGFVGPNEWCSWVHENQSWDFVLESPNEAEARLTPTCCLENDPK